MNGHETGTTLNKGSRANGEGKGAEGQGMRVGPRGHGGGPGGQEGRPNPLKVASWGTVQGNFRYTDVLTKGLFVLQIRCKL